MATPSRTPPKVQRRETNDERKRRENKEAKKLQRRMEPRNQQIRRKQKAQKSHSPVKQSGGIGGWLRPQYSPRMGKSNHGANLQEKNMKMSKVFAQTTPKSSVGDIVRVYFSKDRSVAEKIQAKKDIVRLSYPDGTPMIAVSGKVLFANDTQVKVGFRVPMAPFEYKFNVAKKYDAPPAFVILNSDFIDPDMEEFNTTLPGSVGAHPKVYFDAKTGALKDHRSSPYDYVGFGKLTRETEFTTKPVIKDGKFVSYGTVKTPGRIVVVPPKVKTLVIKGRGKKLGDTVEIYIGKDGARIEKMPESTKSTARVISIDKQQNSDIYTLTYIVPRKTVDGRYVERYDIFSNERDPRLIKALTFEEQKRRASQQPPVCKVKLELKDRDNCFVSETKRRIQPLMDLARQESSTGGKGSSFCGKKRSLQPHQKALFEYAKIIADPNLKPDGVRGLLAFHAVGHGKCPSFDTPVILFSGEVILAGELKPGMKLMGMDSTPRSVLDVGRGSEMMYEITPVKGPSWKCNESHILTLVYNDHMRIQKTPHNTYNVRCHEYANGYGVFRCPTFKTLEEATTFRDSLDPGHLVDISLKDYLGLPKYLKCALKLVRSGPITFPDKKEPLFDPYIIGTWLGDGSSRSTSLFICKQDEKLLEEIDRRLAPGTTVSKRTEPFDNPNCLTCYISRPVGDPLKGKIGSNDFLEALREYGLIQNKHIPFEIKTGSINTRLQVLAGLLDTDGSLSDNCFDIVQKSEQLAKDITFVAQSLGFAAYIKECQKWCTYKGEKRTGTYYRVSIYGEGLENIPTVLERKRASPRQQVKDARRTGFSVKQLEIGEYVGPVLDGDHRYLLGDFTITHNTVSALGIALAFWRSTRRIVFATTKENKEDNNNGVYVKNLIQFFPEYIPMVFKKTQPPDFTNGTGVWDPDANRRLNAWVYADKGANIKPFTDRIANESFNTLSSVLGFDPDAASGECKGVGGLGRDTPEGSQFLIGKYGTVCAKSGCKPVTRQNDGGVLILDEVQSLFKPGNNMSYKCGATFLRHELNKDIYKKHLYTFCFTGTPGTEPGDIIDVLNFVRPNGTPTITMGNINNPEIQRMMYGSMSYVDFVEDTSKFGFGRIINDIKPMSNRYYAGYLKALKEGDLQSSLKEDIGPDYMSKFITLGDVLTTDTATSEYPIEEVKKMASMTPPRALLIPGGKKPKKIIFSDKFTEVIRNLTNIKGKQYVYLRDKSSYTALMYVLEKYGYQFYHPTMPLPTTPGKRFILYKTGAITYKNKTYNLSEADKPKAKAAAEAMSNDADGEKFQIMIATGTFYQGVSVHGFSAVHIADVMSSLAADIQALGRARRMCGHARSSSQKVDIIRYFAEAPKSFDAGDDKKTAILVKKSKEILKLNTDVSEGDKYLVNTPPGRIPTGANGFVFSQGVRKGRVVAQLEQIIKNQAIDCELFKGVHKGVKCGAIVHVDAPEKTETQKKTLETVSVKSQSLSKSKTKSSSKQSPTSVLTGGRRGGSHGGSRGGSRGSGGSKIAPSFDPVSFSTLAKDAQRSSQGSPSHPHIPQHNLKQSPPKSITLSKTTKASPISPQRGSQFASSPQTPPKAPILPKTQKSPISPQRGSQFASSPQTPPKAPMFKLKSPPKPQQFRYVPKKATNLVTSHKGVKVGVISQRNRNLLDKMKSRTK